MNCGRCLGVRPVCAVVVAALLWPGQPLWATDAPPEAAPGEKELYLPAEVMRVPNGNDYHDEESDYCFARMVQGPNIAIFWHQEYGDDPSRHADPRKRFDVEAMLNESERFYDYYVNELKMVQKGSSISDRYKLLIYVFGGDEGTAFGGGIEDKVGALWTPAVRVNRRPYGVLAHELGHSFQFLSSVDSGARPAGAVNEMSAQYMLWQVYPEWMTFENYHLVDFMEKTHYAFLHPTNMYHSPYVLEYWSHNHGQEFFGELSRSTRRGEDVVATYKRIHALTQQQFNDEMFDAARRFITWDLERIQQVARRYANQHRTSLNERGDGWFQIAPHRSPQNYGYNGIRLEVPAAGTEVQVQFRGLVEAGEAGQGTADQAGWRSGFVAHLGDDRRVYSPISAEAEGTAPFLVPEDTAHLWLVVMGAPAEQSPVRERRRGRGQETGSEPQWPYQIKPVGTTIHASCLE